MSGPSKIEWTEHTWNPIVGCSVLSRGCTNCYAMKMANRIERMNAGLADTVQSSKHYTGTTKKVNGNAVWTGKLALAPDNILLQPLKRKKPTTYFVNSMGDLFHEDVPDEWIDKVFAVMALTPHHTYQVLTKRAGRMRHWFSNIDRANRVGLAMLTLVDRVPHGHRLVPWPLPNVWLGVSTERQQEADERIPHLLQTLAAVRFISAEPLLGPVDISDYLVETARINWPSYLEWVIVGGESGPRPMHPDWVRSLREQCKADTLAKFFFKQWGSMEPVLAASDGFSAYGDEPDLLRDAWRSCTVVWPDGRTEQPAATLDYWNQEFDDNDDADTVGLTRCAIVMHRVGKKAAGRLLDGIEHNDMPQRVRG